MYCEIEWFRTYLDSDICVGIEVLTINSDWKLFEFEVAWPQKMWGRHCGVSKIQVWLTLFDKQWRWSFPKEK